MAFLVVDVVGILAETDRPRKYWADLKSRLQNEEGFVQLSAKIGQLKLPAADGKMYPTDCADAETLFRIIQSIPSPKAEPFKQWFAHAAYERLKQKGSVAIDRAIAEYQAMNRPQDWIDVRVQAISSRNDITDEWKGRKVNPRNFGQITNAMSETALGVTSKEHLALKASRLRPISQ